MGIKSIVLATTALVLSTSVNAATLTYSDAGQLLEASGVEVSGILYDVSFTDSSCITAFNNCVDSAFAFNNSSDADTASLALIDQVLSTLPSLTPSSIFGLGPGPDGSGVRYYDYQYSTIMTPYQTFDSCSSIIGCLPAVNLSALLIDSLGGLSVSESGEIFFIAIEFSEMGNQVYADWQVSSVPVPAAAWLFGSGLIGLIGVARRKKS